MLIEYASTVSGSCASLVSRWRPKLAFRLRAAVLLCLLGGALFSGQSRAAAEKAQCEPGFFAMTGDLLLTRPLMMATTLVGTTVFLVSAPFSALGGNIGEAAKTLVVRPFKATFTRPLGYQFEVFHRDEGF